MRIRFNIHIYYWNARWHKNIFLKKRFIVIRLSINSIDWICTIGLDITIYVMYKVQYQYIVYAMPNMINAIFNMHVEYQLMLLSLNILLYSFFENRNRMIKPIQRLRKQIKYNKITHNALWANCCERIKYSYPRGVLYVIRANV